MWLDRVSVLVFLEGMIKQAKEQLFLQTLFKPVYEVTMLIGKIALDKRGVFDENFSYFS